MLNVSVIAYGMQGMQNCWLFNIKPTQTIFSSNALQLIQSEENVMVCLSIYKVKQRLLTRQFLKRFPGKHPSGEQDNLPEGWLSAYWISIMSS